MFLHKLTCLPLRLAAPPPVKAVVRLAGRRPRILDIGCGYGSPRKWKHYIPECEYFGLDRTREFLLKDDFQMMERFYLANLDTDTLREVPNGYFDAVVLSHVIEHVWRGESCLKRLAAKLRPGGVMYVEYPGVRSLQVPHGGPGMNLNFHDDASHIRIYSLVAISNVLLRAGCSIVHAGIRRDWVRLLLTPFLAARGFLQHGNMLSGRLWDFFGTAEVVIARRR